MVSSNKNVHDCIKKSIEVVIKKKKVVVVWWETADLIIM